MKVAFLKSASVNPYQERYFASVAKAGVDVTALPVMSRFDQVWTPEFDVLHLDWLHTLYKTRRGVLPTLAKALYANRALGKIGRQAKIVHTFHNVVSHDSSLPAALETRLVQSLINRVHAFAVFNDVSSHVLRTTYRLRTDQNCYAIPHGNYIDTYQFQTDKKACRDRLGLPTDVFLFMFFGALRENKGITDLIEVFPKVKQQCGAHLVVAGGNATPRVSNSLRHLPSYIHLRDDQIPESEVSIYFGACDAVVLPFRSILSSGSTILAASLGRHCVIPDVDSLTASLLFGTYSKYPVNDLVELANTLISVASKGAKQLEQSGLNAREHVRKTLAWDRIGQQAASMYRSILGYDFPSKLNLT